MEFPKLATPRRFFKVMMTGFQTKLNLPPLFCKKMEQEKSKVATLKSCRGSCEIQVCRNYSTGVISFRQGWSQFVAHHNLSVGDFLVFEHLGTGLHFKVYVFDRTSCEKEYEPELDEEEEAGKPDEHLPKKKKTGGEEKDSVTPNDCETRRFMITVKPTHALRVEIPMKLVRSNNLRKKRAARLRLGVGKRVWGLDLSEHRSHQARFRMFMTRGWPEFYGSNHLKEGDVCVFHLNPTSSTSHTISFDVQIRRRL